MISSFGIIGIVAVVILQAKNGAAQDPSSYEVDGCYSEFNAQLAKDMGDGNSNVNCQEFCRDQGFALSATYNGWICECGNIYPTGKNVSDDKCNSQCVSYTDCYSVQECCGGVDSYTVSMVGDLDTVLQVLRRISNEWLNNDDYRTSMIDQMKANSDVSPPERYLKDWNGGDSDFNHAGWSTCNKNEYITGLNRNNNGGKDDQILRIEAAECSLANVELAYPADSICVEQDWTTSFNSRGWGKCPDSYFLNGLYRTEKNKKGFLHNIEHAQCCKPPSEEDTWHDCYEKDVSDSFNNAGTQSCKDNYFLAGLWRNNCDYLYCIESFYCCSGIPKDDSNSWMENPYLTINTQTADGSSERCSMRAMDTTAKSDSYKCQNFSNQNTLSLDATSFDIQDETPLNVAQPEPIPNLLPAECLGSTVAYECQKTLSTTIIQSSTLTIGTGFEMGVSISDGVEVDETFFGSGMKENFQAAVSSQSSFNTESSKTTETQVYESTTVTVQVPPGEDITINMLRSTQNIQYRWKGIFEALGKYSAVWDNNYEYIQDITTVLTGDDRSIFSFGLWSYPATDTLEVVVTDKYGNQAEGCQYPVVPSPEGQSNNCTMDEDATRKLGSKSKDIKEEL